MATVTILQLAVLESVMGFGRQCHQFEDYTTDSAILALAPFWNIKHEMQKSGKLLMTKKKKKKDKFKSLTKGPT